MISTPTGEAVRLSRSLSVPSTNCTAAMAQAGATLGRRKLAAIVTVVVVVVVVVVIIGVVAVGIVGGVDVGNCVHPVSIPRIKNASGSLWGLCWMATTIVMISSLECEVRQELTAYVHFIFWMLRIDWIEFKVKPGKRVQFEMSQRCIR